MPLPASRDLTATAASGVPANLHNVMQDCIIGAKHGDIWVPINPVGVAYTPSGSPPSLGLPGNGIQWLAAAPVGSVWHIGLPFYDGTRIKQFKWVANSSTGTEDLDFVLKYIQFAGAVGVGGSNVHQLSMVNIPAISGSTWTAYSLATAPFPYTIVHDTQVYIEMTRTQNNGGFIQLQQIYALIDRP